jgi:hypothetical protein
MMNDAQIKAAIIDRLDAASKMGMLSEIYLSHLDGVLRGLIWTKTGTDPGVFITKDLTRVCELSGIEYRLKDGVVTYMQNGETLS